MQGPLFLPLVRALTSFEDGKRRRRRHQILYSKGHKCTAFASWVSQIYTELFSAKTLMPLLEQEFQVIVHTKRCLLFQGSCMATVAADIIITA